MQILITYQPPKKNGSVSALIAKSKVDVKLVEGDQVIMAADPVTWAAIAMVFFEKFAGAFGEATGKELGSAFGKWLAERLGFGSSSDAKQIKALLDEYTRRVVEAIKQQFVEQQFRVAHERLAATTRQFEGFLLAPKTETLDNLTNLDLEVSRVYEELKNLGVGALPSLCRAGVMLITISIRIYAKTRDKGQKQIVLKRINEVLSEIETRVIQITNIYRDRVVGPIESTERSLCEINDPPVWALPSQLQIEPLRPPIYNERFLLVYKVTIDGVESIFRTYSDPCRAKPDLKDKALSEANILAQTRRSFLANELEKEYLIPAAGLRASADKLKDQVNKGIK